MNAKNFFRNIGITGQLVAILLFFSLIPLSVQIYSLFETAKILEQEVGAQYQGVADGLAKTLQQYLGERYADATIMSPQERSGSFWQFDAQSVRFAGAEMASRWVDFVTEHMGVREFEPDGHFEDGTTFDFGTITLQCHHAPGHTDDHYVFFEAHHGVAMTFDIDLTAFGPWYGHVESSITKPSDVGCPSAGTTTPKTGPQVHWSRR